VSAGGAFVIEFGGVQFSNKKGVTINFQGAEAGLELRPTGAGSTSHCRGTSRVLAIHTRHDALSRADRPDIAGSRNTPTRLIRASIRVQVGAYFDIGGTGARANVVSI
jgi:hypothetical protein